MLIFMIFVQPSVLSGPKVAANFLLAESTKDFAVFRLECCLTGLTGLLRFVNVSATEHTGVLCCNLQTWIGRALCQNVEVQDAHYPTRVTQYMRLAPAGKHVDYGYCA